MTENDENYSLTKVAIWFQPRTVRGQTLRAGCIVNRDEFVNGSVQHFAFQRVIVAGGRLLRTYSADRYVMTAPHNNLLRVQRPIEAHCDLDRNVTQRKSKFREEDQRLADGRIGQCFFSTPTHNYAG